MDKDIMFGQGREAMVADPEFRSFYNFSAVALSLWKTENNGREKYQNILLPNGQIWLEVDKNLI